MLMSRCCQLMIFVDRMYLELGYLEVDSSSCFFLTMTTMTSSVETSHRCGDQEEGHYDYSSWLTTNQLLRASNHTSFVSIHINPPYETQVRALRSGPRKMRHEMSQKEMLRGIDRVQKSSAKPNVRRSDICF
jgi:hypothetical protein